MRRLEANLQRGVMLAKRLDRGVQMITHDRAVQPAAQPRLVTRLGLACINTPQPLLTLWTFTVLTEGLLRDGSQNKSQNFLKLLAIEPKLLTF